MSITSLAIKSLLARRATVALTVLALALSVAMLLGVEKVRRDARLAFANTISGTDLVVGARSGAVPLLLYSVFRIGNATNNISWQSYQQLAADPRVRWTVPLSLGDAHRGYRVLGTTPEYFEHYGYARTRKLRFTDGAPFDDTFGAVLGATVAKQLGYSLGDEIVVSHGAGTISFVVHDEDPFTVVGILAPTGTPVDRTVHVSLAGIEAIHADMDAGGLREDWIDELTPKSITAFLVGLESRRSIFTMQRAINEFAGEPLLAIVPGVALAELWDLIGVAERALAAVSVMVVVTGLTGMLAVVLASLEARRREMAVLRAVGARPSHVFGLFMAEAAVLAVAGVLAGLALLYGAIAVARPFVAANTGLELPLSAPQATELSLLLAVVLAVCAIAAIPAWRAYRLSLSDGLSPRI